ncbi:hypothetical protein [Streptomyces sp. NPDC052811]|uniref:hypothetical protein n=1 Tax=Streptomyces sp. NPDC052811 TaxID=3155731 RepID=UPI0034132F57
MSTSSEFRGFDLVRHGYDRHEVDRYLKTLSEASSPVSPPPFQIAWRGYDRHQVDVRIRDLLADRDSNG